MDARRVAGWVTLPDGQRTVCPRCEGQAFIRAKGVSSLMPRAQDIATGDHFFSRDSACRMYKLLRSLHIEQSVSSMIKFHL